MCVLLVCNNTRAEEQTKNYRCAAEEKLAVKKVSKTQLRQLRRVKALADNFARKDESVVQLKRRLAEVELEKQELQAVSEREAMRFVF